MRRIGNTPLFLFLLLFLLFLSGCRNVPVSTPLPASPELLTAELRGLSDIVDPSEAEELAREAIHYSLILRRLYGVNSPPLLHNFLVNIGVKKRGLCYHWADDLLLHLRQYRFRTLRILPVGSHVGSYWSEHNALAVFPSVPKDFPLANAILLDPWRTGGRLYFIPVGKDPKHPWHLRCDRMPTAGRSDPSGKGAMEPNALTFKPRDCR